MAVSLVKGVERKCAALSDDVIHSRSLVMLGSVLDQALQRQVALQHLNRARVMLMAVGNTSNLAVAYQAISRVHYRERRLPEAPDAIEEAWKQAELSDNTFIQAVVSLTYSMILFTANKDIEAQKHIEIALRKALHFESAHCCACVAVHGLWEPPQR